VPSVAVVAQPASAKGISAAGGEIDNSGAAVADKDLTKFRRLGMMYLSDQIRSAPILNTTHSNVVDLSDLMFDICDREVSF
jgi:hypothetical protein